MKTVKTAITIPENLLQKLDNFLEKMKLKSGSKVISEALTEYLTEREWLLTTEGRVIGLLVMIYDEKRGETVKRVLDIQHDFIHSARFTFHVHLSHDRCLEVVFLEGEKKTILSLVNRIEQIVGVRMVRFIPIEVEEVSQRRLHH